MSTLPERQSVSDSSSDSSEEDVKNCGKEADPTSVDFHFLKTGKDRHNEDSTCQVFSIKQDYDQFIGLSLMLLNLQMMQRSHLRMMMIDLSILV